MRKGMMLGRGKGYKNVIGKDPHIHSQSAKGIKQPQFKNMNFMQLKKQGVFLKYQGDADHDGVKNIKDCKPLDPKRQDLTITDFKASEIKKLSGAERVGYQWHNKNKTGGNFGYNLFFPNPNAIGGRDDYMFSGEYDTTGKLRWLRVSKGFSAGISIPQEKLIDMPTLIGYMKERIKMGYL